MDRFTSEELQAELDRRKASTDVELAHPPLTRFAAFWERYPRKVSKREAYKAFLRLSPDQQRKAVDVIDAHVWMWVQEGRGTRLIPHASTWLNQWRFDDEIGYVPERSTTPTANTRTGDVLRRLEES